jgi:hypothetical protein
LLRQLADDHGAGRVGQPLELVQVLPQVGARPRTLEGRSNEERPLDRLLDLNRIFCQLYPLVGTTVQSS